MRDFTEEITLSVIKAIQHKGIATGFLSGIVAGTILARLSGDVSWFSIGITFGVGCVAIYMLSKANKEAFLARTAIEQAHRLSKSFENFEVENGKEKPL